MYLLLKKGIEMSVPDTDSTPHPGKTGHLIRPSATFSPSDAEKGRSGGQKAERVRVVDWEHPENDDFLLVSQFSVTGALFVTSAFILQLSALLPAWWSSS